MKICKIQNGTLSYLFIPEEIKWQGWKNFCSCLDSFFAIKHVRSKESFGFSENKQVQEGSKGAVSAYKGEGWRNFKERSVSQKKEEIKSYKQRGAEIEQQPRDWRNALVVYRNTMNLSWGDIRKRVQTKIGRFVDVVALAAGRAIFWCQEEEEISSLLSNPLQFSNGRNHVRIKRWSMFVHWDNIQIHVTQSWIGLEGLPINMWNIRGSFGSGT